MRKARNDDPHNTLKRSIEKMLSEGGKSNEQTFQEIESRNIKRPCRSAKDETGVSISLNLCKLNGKLLQCADVSNLIHSSIFGSVISKPKWATIFNNRSLLQTLVIRVNCPENFIEDTKLPFVDNFFKREWIQASAELNCRKKFWTSIMNVELSIQEQIKIKCTKATKYQKETGTIDKSDFVASLQEMASSGFPFPGEDGIVATKSKYSPITADSPLYSIDCEMCITTAKIHELTRITIVGEMGEIILDTLVKPRNEITDYLTKYSGITAGLLDGVETRLEDVQRAIQAILPPDAILVGHSLEFDLRAMKMAHPYCIDAALVLNYTNNSANYKNSLKNLVELFLDEKIQGEYGHCSYEDAWAAMRLVKLKLEHGIMFGNVRNGWNYRQFLNEKKGIECKIPERRKIAKKESCESCNLPVTVKCIVKNCSCNFASEPSICLNCHGGNESVQGDFDWENSLKFEKCLKTRPINHFLRKDKMVSLLCAFDRIDLDITCTTSKRLRWKDPHSFKSCNAFLENVVCEILNDKLILCELDYRTICKDSDIEIADDGNLILRMDEISSVIDSNVEKLISSVANNSLILLVLASKKKSIIYLRIKKSI